MELRSVFFLLKASQPCRDWLGVRTDSKHWGIRCGYNPKDSVFSADRSLEMKFRSDSHNQEMGFWMSLHGEYCLPVSSCRPAGDVTIMISVEHRKHATA